MKYLPAFPKKKATAIFLVICLLSFLLPGAAIKPNIAKAQGSTEVTLSVGSYRGLKQEVTVPVSLKNFSPGINIAALTFTVTAPASVTIKKVAPGADLPADAVLSFYPTNPGLGESHVNVAIYLSRGSISRDAELVDITFARGGGDEQGTETLDLSNITAFDVDNNEMSSNVGKVSGYIDVRIMYGDITKDDTVTIADAAQVLHAVVKGLPLDGEEKEACNVSRSPNDEPEDLTINDVLLIARYAAGIITHFPVNNPSIVDSSLPAPPSGKATTPEKLEVESDGDELQFTVTFPYAIPGFVGLKIEKEENDEKKIIVDERYKSSGGGEVVTFTVDNEEFDENDTYFITITHSVEGDSKSLVINSNDVS